MGPPLAMKYASMSIKDLRCMLTLKGYDCSQCLEKSELIAAAQRLDAAPDFDQAARDLFAELHLDPKQQSISSFNYLDPIWQDPRTGARVYVGNVTAASNRITLDERKIRGIVNCQDWTSRNFFEDDDNEIEYHRCVVARLAISDHRVRPLQFGMQSAFSFIQSHLDMGHSVLVHCLAGAHRAGTVGTAWLMYKTGKNLEDALVSAKACRPIINPFSTLMELLRHLEKELGDQRAVESKETDG